MFKGRVALVTGGGSGIGAAACQRLAIEGAKVVVVDLKGETAAHTVSLIEAAGGTAIAVAADIASEAGNVRMFDEAEAAFGQVDLAFLNAGILQPYIPLEEVTVALFDRVIALTRLKAGGACVATSSAAGYLGFAEAAAYSTSKHGLIGLVRSSAAAFAARNLRINAICPGMVLTPMNSFAAIDTIEPPETLANAPYRGGLTPQHVAETALYLLSQAAAGVNGQAQLVDSALLSAFPPLPA
jgi:NAD(P)-dependent dehydrogenase (short-subunit alcohol dehydrogenase family)